MAEMGAELVLPGHGPPIVGAANIKRAFLETAAFLDAIINPCLEMIDAGYTLNELQTMIQRPPINLKRQVFLQQNYDDWRFIIVNIWRLYAGGWDQNPAHLLPAKETDVAREVALIAGGAERLAARAKIALDAGNLELATTLAQWAGEAAPSDKGVHDIRAQVYSARYQYIRINIEV